VNKPKNHRELFEDYLKKDLIRISDANRIRAEAALMGVTKPLMGGLSHVQSKNRLTRQRSNPVTHSIEEPSFYEAIEKADEIINLLRRENNDPPIYIVGGYIRDALLSKKPKDMDLTSALKPEEFKALCEEKGFKTLDVGIDHGTVGVLIDGELYEHTTFRKDVKTDGRRAEVLFSESLEEDAMRRDFTINSIYYTTGPWYTEAIELQDHIEDLKEKTIDTCGDPYKRFEEDYLRIMRLLRFAIKLKDQDFTIGTQTYQAACLLAHKIKANVSKERILEELYKGYLEGGVDVFLDYLRSDTLGIRISEGVFGVNLNFKPLHWKPSKFKGFLVQLVALNPDLVHELPLTRDDVKAWSLLIDLLSDTPVDLWKRKNSFNIDIADDYFWGSPFYLEIIKGIGLVDKITQNWPKHLTGKDIGLWQRKEFNRLMKIK